MNNNDSFKFLGKTTGKPSPAASKSNTLSTSKSVADRKSPVPSPKPASSAASSTGSSSSTCNAEAEQDDAKPEGLKVPPLKIVIPQSSGNDNQDGQGSNRNGKSAQRQHSLPYVVASSSGENNDKEGGTAGSPGTESVSGQAAGKDEKNKDGNFTGGTAEDQVMFL